MDWIWAKIRSCYSIICVHAPWLSHGNSWRKKSYTQAFLCHVFSVNFVLISCWCDSKYSQNACFLNWSHIQGIEAVICMILMLKNGSRNIVSKNKRIWLCDTWSRCKMKLVAGLSERLKLFFSLEIFLLSFAFMKFSGVKNLKQFPFY